MFYSSSVSARDFYDGPADTILRICGYDGLRVGYFEDEQDDFAAAQARTVDMVCAPLELSAESRVLDVGCGVGGPAVQIAQTFGCRVLGVTISPSQTQRGRKAVRDAGVDGLVQIVQMDAHFLSAPAGSFTAAIAIESLLHMDLAMVLGNIYQALRPGAALSLCDWRQIRALTRRQRQDLRDGIAMEVVSLEQYVREIESSGFELVDVQDWTEAVDPTYDRWLSISPAAQTKLPETFVEQFKSESQRLIGLIRECTGYMCIVARKPS